MKSNKVEVKDYGEIKLVRNPKARNIRLRIAPNGQPVVTAPPLVPMALVKQFVNSKRDWIKKNSRQTVVLEDGHVIGSNHVIVVSNGKKLSVVTSKTKISVILGPEDQISDPVVQSKLQAAATRALKSELNEFIKAKLDYWVDAGVGEYDSLSVKKMTSRWGSYSSAKKVSFSIYMAQLPDDLTDYIVVHELAHSKHLNHSTKFWDHVAKFIPNYKQMRKNLKDYHMSIEPR